MSYFLGQLSVISFILMGKRKDLIKTFVKRPIQLHTPIKGYHVYATLLHIFSVYVLLYGISF